MNLDATTFVLEIVNFLILVWLLRHFLYRPVLAAIERRRQAVADTLARAEADREEAQRLQTEYAGRDAQWTQEVTRRRRTLTDELDTERRKRMQALEKELADERRRQEAVAAHRQAAQAQAIAAQAMQQSARFAARLLERLNGPDLQPRVLDALLEDLDTLPQARRDTVGAALGSAASVEVSSAQALATHARQRLTDALGTLADPLPPLQYMVDPALLSGLRIRAGGWELEASLTGELRAFAELATHE